MTWRIPLAQPDLTGNERRYVDDAIASSWISSSGPYVDRFESEFAKLCDAEFALGVANGTVGLHLLMVALGIGPGDEVIVPSMTYIATANAVSYTGASPVFVDVERATWCLDPSAVEAAVTQRTVGVIAVHLYGHPADMDALRAVTDRHGLFLVEDAAEAHGARYRDRPVGSLADAAVFSFYGNKIITSGEGGAITTSDRELDARLRLLRGQGMDITRRYFFTTIGYNYRLTNVACAILCAQMERIEEMVAQRRTIEAQYRRSLSGLRGLEFQPRAEWADAVPWLVSVTIDPDAFGCTRDSVMTLLAHAGIETRPFFIPIHRLPPYAEAPRGASLSITEYLGESGMNLPTYTGLHTGLIAHVVGSIHRAPRRE